MRKALVAAMITAGIGLAGCAEAIQQKEDMLAAAGFRVKLADSPGKIAALKRLPPHKFTMRATPNGSISYLYADPTVCKCLYYGDEQAYSAYQNITQAQQLADKRLMAAQLERDASWNWREWGSWGPYRW